MEQEKGELLSKLFIGNLAYGCTESELRAFFEQETDEIVFVDVLKGYGFVKVKTTAEADRLKLLMNKKEVKGRAINVEVANPKSKSKRKRKGNSEGGTAGEMKSGDAGWVTVERRIKKPAEKRNGFTGKKKGFFKGKGGKDFKGKGNSPKAAKLGQKGSKGGPFANGGNKAAGPGAGKTKNKGKSKKLSKTRAEQYWPKNPVWVPGQLNGSIPFLKEENTSNTKQTKAPKPQQKSQQSQQKSQQKSQKPKQSKKSKKSKSKKKATKASETKASKTKESPEKEAQSKPTVTQSKPKESTQKQTPKQKGKVSKGSNRKTKQKKNTRKPARNLNDLTDGMLLKMFSFLNHPSFVVQCSLVCKRWSKLSNTSSLWKALCCTLQSNGKRKSDDWKALFIAGYLNTPLRCGVTNAVSGLVANVFYSPQLAPRNYRGLRPIATVNFSDFKNYFVETTGSGISNIRTEFPHPIDKWPVDKEVTDYLLSINKQSGSVSLIFFKLAQIGSSVQLQMELECKRKGATTFTVLSK